IYAHAAASGELAALGINFTGKCYENWRWHNHDGYHDILAALHPAFVNLTGAEQYLDARQRGFEIPHRAPLTRIFWRHMIHQPPGVAEKTDRGMWRLPPHEYIDNLIIPHGDHLTGWYNVTDCEGF